MYTIHVRPIFVTMVTMKPLLLSLCLLLLFETPVFAQTASASASPSPTASTSGQVKGLYDDSLANEYSDATGSASISATPTPRPRTTTLSTARTPVSGAVEDTIFLLVGGTALFLLGYRFSRE